MVAAGAGLGITEPTVAIVDSSWWQSTISSEEKSTKIGVSTPLNYGIQTSRWLELWQKLPSQQGIREDPGDEAQWWKQPKKGRRRANLPK